MFGLGMTELLIILAIVLLIFGPKRLKNIGSDLGGAIKGFRKAVTDEEEAAAPAKPAEKVIEGEAAPSSTADSAEAERNSKV